MAKSGVADKITEDLSVFGLTWTTFNTVYCFTN